MSVVKLNSCTVINKFRIWEIKSVKQVAYVIIALIEYGTSFIILHLYQAAVELNIFLGGMGIYNSINVPVRVLVLLLKFSFKLSQHYCLGFLVFIVKSDILKVRFIQLLLFE